VKEWKAVFHINGIWKQAGVIILLSDKVDFTPKLVTGDKISTYYKEKT
jgi:hypothetical protein